MTIQQTGQGYSIYTTFNGFLFQRHYIGYTKKESVSLFRDELKRMKSGRKY